MNIYTTPIALQRAGAKFFQVVKMLYGINNPVIPQLYSKGKITITTIYNGYTTKETYANISGSVSIKSDANTPIYITGYVDVLSLSISSDPHILFIGISKNNSVRSLNCNYCSEIKEIIMNAQNESICNSIATAISSSSSVTGTVTVYPPLTYADIISTAATTAGWNYKEA